MFELFYTIEFIAHARTCDPVEVGYETCGFSDLDALELQVFHQIQLSRPRPGARPYFHPEA